MARRGGKKRREKRAQREAEEGGGAAAPAAEAPPEGARPSTSYGDGAEAPGAAGGGARGAAGAGFGNVVRPETQGYFRELGARLGEVEVGVGSRAPTPPPAQRFRPTRSLDPFARPSDAT